MEVTIKDGKALRAIRLSKLVIYLKEHGWTDKGQLGERAVSIYDKTHRGRVWEILVPHREDIGGYTAGIGEAIEVLAAVEGRSQLDVYYEIHRDLRGLQSSGKAAWRDQLPPKEEAVAVAEVAEKRWEEGRKQYGPRFRGDPVEHLNEELIDALHYARKIADERRYLNTRIDEAIDIISGTGLGGLLRDWADTVQKERKDDGVEGTPVTVHINQCGPHCETLHTPSCPNYKMYGIQPAGSR